MVRLHRVLQLADEDVGRIDGIPATSPARTIIDLAGSISEQRLEICLDAALQQRLVTLERIWERLEMLAGRGRKGVTVLRRLVRERSLDGGVSESVLETRVRRLMRSARLPKPAQQHPVTLAGFGSVRLDFAYPERMLAIEADGYRWHGGRGSWARDLERRNALTAAGWRVLHVTWEDVERRPRETIERITTALELGVREPAPRAPV